MKMPMSRKVQLLGHQKYVWWKMSHSYDFLVKAKSNFSVTLMIFLEYRHDGSAQLIFAARSPAGAIRLDHRMILSPLPGIDF